MPSAGYEVLLVAVELTAEPTSDMIRDVLPEGRWRITSMSSGNVWLIPVRRTLTSVMVPCLPETLIEAGVLGAPTSGMGIALALLKAGGWRRVVMRAAELSLSSAAQTLPSAPAVMKPGTPFVRENSPMA